MKYLLILLTKTYSYDIQKMYIISKTLFFDYKKHIINVESGIIFNHKTTQINKENRC